MKKDGSRVPYDREKIIVGVRKACYKREIPVRMIEELVEAIEEQLFREYGQEAPSEAIGNLTMTALRRLDKVAYIRYASVYKQFEDLGQFITEVEEVMHRADDAPGQKQFFKQ